MNCKVDTIRDLKQPKIKCKLEQALSVKNLLKLKDQPKNHQYNLNRVLIIGKLNKMLKEIRTILGNLILI